MNEKTGKTNHYIYKWTPETAAKLEKALQPGDRFSVSIRDFDDPEHRASFAALRKKGRECYCVLPVLWRPGQGPDPEEIVEEVDGFYQAIMNVRETEAFKEAAAAANYNPDNTRGEELRAEIERVAAMTEEIFNKYY